MNANATISKLSKPQLLLLLLGIDDGNISERGVVGITRLQKLLFLLWKEAGIKDIGDSFAFRPDKAGPLSPKLYDELELLENLQYVRSEVKGESPEAEAVELKELSFEQLMGDDARPYQDPATRANAATADTFEERRFMLTEKGLAAAKALFDKPDAKPFVEGIRKIKSKFASYSLQDLLYHVYDKYEDDGWISESEIRDKVFAKGRRR